MLRLLLVDDEQPILDGLKQLVEWDKLGIGSIETATNGREAISVIETFKPDIVITDIKMPVMNGLELIRRIREMLPETRCVILCGYQDFEYAREAMKYGVVRYLVKPVEEDELKEIIGELREAILNANREKKRMEDLDRRFTESMPYLRNKLLYSIVCGEMKDMAEAELQLRRFGIDRFPRKFICSVVEFETEGPVSGFDAEDIELIRFAAANIADELIRSRTGCHVFYMIEKQIIVIIDVSDCHAHIADALLKSVIHHISKYLNLPVTIGVSSVCEGLGEAPRGFKEARSALRYKLLMGKGKVIYHDEVERNLGGELMIPVSLWKRLENSVITGDGDSVPGAVRDLFSELGRMKGVDPAEVLLKCREELLLIRRNLEDIGLNDRTLRKFIGRFENEMHSLTLDELEKQFAEVFRDIAEQVFRTNRAGIRAVIGQVKQYIDRNYASDITLSTIAEKFYVNASYASRLFKQELSENFIDYLTGRRMSEAEKLLQSTDMTVYEISEKIGYGNPKYFSQLFKRHTGMSPREYREKAVK